MYKFSLYLDKTFKKGVTETQAREFKKLIKKGKSVKTYLNDRPTSIYVAATINGKYIKVKTDEKVLPVYWDSTSQSVKPNHPNAFEFNADLQALKSKIDLEYRNARANNPDITYDQIKEVLQRVVKGNMPNSKGKGFFEVWEEFLADKSKTVKPITIIRYGAVRTHLEDFQAKRYRLTLDKINRHFGTDLAYFLTKERGLLNNTVSKTLVNIKVFIRWAIEKGFMKDQDYLLVKPKFDEADIIYLSETELMKIYNLELNEDKKFTKIRDVFCFQCFTGQRYSDILNLRWNDIKTNENNEIEWHLYQRKGNKTRKVLVPISKLAVSILDKYKRNNAEENGRVLPAYCDQMANSTIKKLGKMVGLTEPITLVKYSGKERVEICKPKWQFISTHCARRTFVTLSLEKKMRPEVVRSITGHETEKAMRPYIKITDKVKKSEFKQAWG